MKAQEIFFAALTTIMLAGPGFAESCLATEQQFGIAAEEVSIPDPGLNAAIREMLQKPAGPLTPQDLLSLTNLDASRREIRSVAGLEAARNLVWLDLQVNRLTNFSLPPTLTKLRVLNVSINSLTNFTLPSGLTNLNVLTLGGNALKNLNLPEDMGQLNSLGLENNRFSSLDVLSNLTGLIFLDLSFNSFANLSLPGGLTNLSQFIFEGNLLTNLTLPAGLTSLTELHLSQNQFTTFTLPAGLTNLIVLDLFFNQLTNVTLPDDLRSLSSLDLDFNRFARLDLPSNLIRLSSLNLRANLLTTFNLPLDIKALMFLDIGENQLTNVNLPAGLNRLQGLRLSGNTNLMSLVLPPDLTNLTGIFLRFNGLTNLALPSDLVSLVQIDVLGNRLANFNLPAGLTNLITLVLSGNELTNLTLPPDMTRLSTLVLNGNPLATLVLSEPLAATLADPVAALRDQGVSVFTYPLLPELVRVQMFAGRFQFGITGPPGVYTIVGSTNLTTWDVVGTVDNPVGSVLFNDVTINVSPKKFYRAQRQSPPTNMVFIAPNTFTIGTPANEVNRQTDEGPLTTVTLSHGFWIGKHEVTQREYQEIVGSNPTQFPGDLNRPIETVSWLDATNYCARLTQQELAAGRIPPGSRYRLPTEAEWECAARAGTSTRFSYGDDPNFTGLTNHAWYASNSGFGTHPVGQKAPNPWGLYDMEGNVLEWTQDWYGPYPGGAVTDPQGPASNPLGVRVIRGGAWDSGEADCRSGRRQAKGVHPFITDSIVGFRVVLVTER